MKQNIETLKEYFETGDRPTQQNYADLIDSLGMPMIGEMKQVSFGFAPGGWVKCNGQLLDPATHPELFALIGTTYGGDGTTTFAVPDMGGRVPVGYGNPTGLSTYTIGQTGGEEVVTLTEEQLPVHSHTGTIDLGTNANVAIPVFDDSGSTHEASNSYLAHGEDINDEAVNLYSSSNDATLAAFDAPVSGTITTNSTGNGTSINNLQPYLAVNYIIAVEGINPM